MKQEYVKDSFIKMHRGCISPKTSTILHGAQESTNRETVWGRVFITSPDPVKKLNKKSLPKIECSVNCVPLIVSLKLYCTL